MKTDNTQIITTANTLPYTTTAYDVSQVAMFAIQIKQVSGTGTYKLQASCDEGVETAGGEILQVSTWSDVAGSTQILNTDDSVVYDYVNNGFKWLRVVATGTGTATARINTKGI